MAEHNEVQELNLDEKVVVKNIAGWFVGFARKADGIGDIGIPQGGSIRLSRGEIIAQVQIGNKLFTGVDGRGSHATLFIDDEATRRELDFESDDRKQDVFSEKKVEELFKKNRNFEKEFAEAIYTRAEKYAVMETIKKLNINDYAKIRFAEQHTGYRYG